jgi:hypothetical protein
MDLLMPGALLASFSVANNYPEMRGRSWKTMEVQAPTKKMPGPWGKCAGGLSFSGPNASNSQVTEERFPVLFHMAVAGRITVDTAPS